MIEHLSVLFFYKNIQRVTNQGHSNSNYFSCWIDKTLWKKSSYGDGIYTGSPLLSIVHYDKKVMTAWARGSYSCVFPIIKQGMMNACYY